MKKTKLSVIVPTLNEETMIGNCIEALLDQRQAGSIEIIVVDNGSTDRTIEVVKSFPVKLLHCAQRGQIFARRMGFTNANSDLLATIDADTIVDPNWADQMTKFLMDYNYDAVSGYVGGHDEDFGILGEITTWVFNKFVFDMQSLAAGQPFLYGSNIVIKKSAWEHVSRRLILIQKYKGKQVWEDLQIAINMHEAGLSIGLLQQKTARISVRRFREHNMLEVIRYVGGGVRTFYLYRKWRSVAGMSILLAFQLPSIGLMKSIMRLKQFYIQAGRRTREKFITAFSTLR